MRGGAPAPHPYRNAVHDKEESTMGILSSLLITCVKVAAAPVYVPYKMVKALDELEKPATYNWWYHDSGREQSEAAASDGSERGQGSAAG
jgi:hypothetical protein